MACATRYLASIGYGIILLCALPAHSQVCLFEDQVYTASDASIGAHFGNAIAVSGDVTVVGAWRDPDAGFDSGAAYIFRFDGLQWNQETKLTASDGEGGEFFGQSVAIDGDTVVIGSPNSHSAQGLNTGSMYVYQYNGAHWIERAKLAATDGQTGTQFGLSVSISGTTILASSPYDNDRGANSGSAYIFTHNGSTWSQHSKLTASDGFSSQHFGRTSVIIGTDVYIGAPLDNDNGFESGSVYLFRDIAGTWTQLGKLLPSDGAPDDRFGLGLAISGDYLAIGATQADGTFNTRAGAVYIFWNDRFVWVEQNKVISPDRADEFFGLVIALSETNLAVRAEEGLFNNTVYAFARSGTSWNQTAKLETPYHPISDKFGDAIAIRGDLVVVGNPSYDEGIPLRFMGNFTSFDLLATPCPADLTGDCALNFFDVSTFLSAFSAQDPVADFNTDGSFNFFDVSAFLTEFSTGCN